MKKELKEIMDLSFPFCKNSDDQLALYFQKINNIAHDAEIYINQRKLSKENHWTEEHYKNYHKS
tara:strand:- start:310 stop:501 length:192 start_codon:yes stop_codon:yes gene_type:complete